MYKIDNGNVAPVNYDTHSANAHSLTRAEGQAHVVKDGKTIDQYLTSDYFSGSTLVVRLKRIKYESLSVWGGFTGKFKAELKSSIKSFVGEVIPNELLLTIDFYPADSSLAHDSNFVLTLRLEAASYRINKPGFNLYETS